MLNIHVVSLSIFIGCHAAQGQTGLNIMVATGYRGSYMYQTEVIDTERNRSCHNLPAEYPHGVEEAVALQHNSKMVICGGFPGSDNCLSYSNDSWNLEPFLIEPANYGMMSVEIRPGEWLVMGGIDSETSTYLTATRLFRDGIFIPGPDLPEPIYGGSAVMLNETHLFVAGGIYASGYEISPQNYLLNIINNQWTQLPNRTTSFSGFHSSGTFYNSTVGEIQVATLGNEDIEVYSPEDNDWHRVPYILPTHLWRSAAIQQGPDSFILIGGETDFEDISRAMYVFDEHGLSIYKELILKDGRRSHVVMPISKSDFACN